MGKFGKFALKMAMKMKQMKFFLLVVAVLFGVCLASCIHDDFKMTPVFSRSDAVGTFTVKEIKGGVAGLQMAAGSVMSFNSDGTCETDCADEKLWKLEGGRICTYNETSEPLSVFQLIGKTKNVYEVWFLNVNLADSAMVSLVLQKQ